MANDIDTEVALLRRDSEENMRLVSKMDAAIEKLTDLGSSVTKMLALHEQRIDRLEQIDTEIHGLVEKRRAELQTDINVLEGKLASTMKEISNDLNDTEDRIMDAIKEVRADIKTDSEDKAKDHEALIKRVEALERWRYILLGAGLVIGFVVEKIALPLLGIHS